MISVIENTDTNTPRGASRINNMPGVPDTRGVNPTNQRMTSNLAVSIRSKNPNNISIPLGSDTAVLTVESNTDRGFTLVVSKAEAQKGKAAVKAKKAETQSVPQRRPSVATVTTTASTKTTSTVHKAAIVAFSKAFVQSTLPPTSAPAAKKGKATKTTVKLLTVDDIKATLASTIGWEGARVQSVDITEDEHDQDGVKLSKVHFIDGPAFLPAFRRAYTEVFGKVNVSYKVVTTEGGKKFLNVFLKPWVERATKPESQPESKVAIPATTESSIFPSLSEQPKSEPKSKQWGPKAKAVPATVAPATVAPATELTALQMMAAKLALLEERLAKAEAKPKAAETQPKMEVTKPKATETQPKTEVTKPKATETQPKTEVTKPEFKEVLGNFSKSFVQSMLPPLNPTAPKAMTREQITEKLKDSSWTGFGVASQNVTVDEHVQDGFTFSKAKLYNGPFFKSGIRKAYTELFGKVNVSHRVIESNDKKYLNVFVKPWVEKEKVTVTAPEPKPESDSESEPESDQGEEEDLDEGKHQDEVDEEDEEELSEQASILAKAEQQLSQQQTTEVSYTLPGFTPEQLLFIQQMPKEMMAAMLSQATAIHQATPQQVESQQVESQQVESQQVESQQATPQQVESQQVEADSVPSSPVATPAKTVLPNKPGKGKKGKNKGTDHSFFDTDPELQKLTLAQAEAVAEQDEVPEGGVGKTPKEAPPSTVQPQPQPQPQPEPVEETKKSSKKTLPSKLNFLTAATAGTKASAKLPSSKVAKNSYKADLGDL